MQYYSSSTLIDVDIISILAAIDETDHTKIIVRIEASLK